MLSKRLMEFCISITDCEHKTAPIANNGQYISVRTANISNGKIDKHSCNRVSAKVYKEWTKREKPKKGDIVLAREAPVGEVGYIDQDDLICLGQRTVLIRSNPKLVDSKYLLYKLVSPKCKDDLVSRSAGSVVEHLNVKDIRNFTLSIHEDISEQEAIAEVLSSLDDKIDLLQRNNRTLEALSEAFFRKWFIEDANEATVGEEFNVVMGQSPPGNTYNEFKKGLPLYQGRTDFTYRFPKQRIYCTKPSRYAQKHDTLLSVRAPVGDLNIANSLCSIGRGIASICHKESSIHYSYTYNVFKVLKELFNIHEDSGTIFGSINKNEVLNMACVKLEHSKIKLYNSQIAPLEDKIYNNCMQIANVESLRDSLLPKLMNGTIGVNKLVEA